MAGVKDYSTNPDNNGIVAGLPYFPEGQLADTLNNASRQVMADIAAYVQSAVALLSGSTIADETNVARLIGYRDLPLLDTAGPYTIALSDRGKARKLITGSQTISIPPNTQLAFPRGALIGFYNDTNTAKTIAPMGDVVLRLDGTTSLGSRTIAAYGRAVLLKVDDGATWSISGPGVA